jgi:hypothetical protein
MYVVSEHEGYTFSSIGLCYNLDQCNSVCVCVCVCLGLYLLGILLWYTTTSACVGILIMLAAPLPKRDRS